MTKTFTDYFSVGDKIRLNCNWERMHTNDIASIIYATSNKIIFRSGSLIATSELISSYELYKFYTKVCRDCEQKDCPSIVSIVNKKIVLL